jgi:hypothetical protein
MTEQDAWEQKPLPGNGADDLLNWQPPELVARANDYAARDAAVAANVQEKQARSAKRQARKGQPPVGKHPRLSLGALCVCVIFTVLDMAQTYVFRASYEEALKSRGLLGLALGTALAVVFIALMLVILLPLRRRRAVLAIALGLWIFIAGAQCVVTMLHGNAGVSAARLVAATAAGTLVILLLSPPLWLLIGCLRGKSTERLATALLLALAVVTVLSQRAKPLVCALSLVQNLSYALLLFSWPVLTKPMLQMEDKAA